MTKPDVIQTAIKGNWLIGEGETFPTVRMSPLRKLTKAPVAVMPTRLLTSMKQLVAVRSTKVVGVVQSRETEMAMK